MRERFLQWKWVARAALFVLLLCTVGLTNAMAQSPDELAGVYLGNNNTQIGSSKGQVQFNASTNTWEYVGSLRNPDGSNVYKDGETSVPRSLYTSQAVQNTTFHRDRNISVYIGDDGTATNSYLPSYSYYNYTLSQQIYTADEIDMSGIINSVAFFNGGSEQTRSYNLYMLQTDKVSFENTNDWMAVTAADLVFSGYVTMFPGEWTTITLDTPFNYDGTSNLAIIVDDNTGSWSSGMTCRVFNTETTQAIRIYNDGTNYNPYNPTQYSGTLHTVKNQIILDFYNPNYRLITATTSPAGAGTINGIGGYMLGEICTLTATAIPGCNFLNWTEDGTVVSTNPMYSFTVTGNRELVANFETTPITFADANVKNICVSYWDTNGDGELSYAEAALVTDLNDAFGYNSDITSFDELQYFIGLSFIGDYAFHSCNNLVSIVIPNSVISIGARAFENCNALVDMEIPSSVTSIGWGAFFGCSGMEQLTVEEGNPVFDSRNNCNAIIETATNVLAVGCKNTVIPNSVTAIGGGAFIASGLTYIEIPNSVTSIGNYAFQFCSGLTSIVIPNSVTLIDYRAFENCSGLVSFEIPNSVTYMGWGAFFGCSAIESLTIEEGNPVYDSRENCNAFIETASNTLVVGCKNTVIPNSVTAIGGGAFVLCTDLSSIEIPNSVTSIGNYAFQYCYNLPSIEIPESVTFIDDYAFQYCWNITSMTVLPVTPPSLGGSVFDGVNTDILVYVPCASAEAYINEGWGGFYNFVGMCPYEIAVRTHPTEGGIVNGTGVYRAGETCTLIALPNDGYVLKCWTENDEVVSSSPEYSFVVTSDRNLIAEFEEGVIVGNQNSTVDYFPFYTYYNYTLTQQIYTAEEIGRGGLITAISFNYTGNENTDLTNTIDVYLKHTSKSAFEYDTDWESVGTSDLHFSGTLLTDAVAGWKRIELDTPFEYNGTDNLLVCVNNNSGFWTDVRQWYAYPTGENRAICAYSYYTNYDPFNPMQYSGTLYDVNNEILISIQTLGPATFVSNPNPIDLGVRPNGAWMRPTMVSITNLGSVTQITNIQASNNYFQPNLDELSMPFVLGYQQSFDMGIGWGTDSGVINANLLVDYGDGQQAQIPMTATAYEPTVGDVWENPIQLNSFPYTATFNSANHPLYDNYVLPPSSIADGADVVYQMTFNEDTYLNASVTSGDNAKVALYREGFQGLGGPDLENNYLGPEMTIEEWLYYDNGENAAAIGTGGGEFWWGIKLDVTAYQGAKLTKVSMYDYASMEGEIMIYQTEGTPYGDPLLRQNFSITGSGEFVEFNLNMPYTLDASLPLWIVMHHVSGNGWSASCCYDTGDPNGRWISLDNSYWEDLVNYGLNYTWMLRGMVTNRNGREVVLGDRSEIQNLTVTPGVYYLVASSTSNEWTVEINAGEVPCPDMAYNPVPENRAEEVTPNNVSLRWTLGDRTTEYCLRFGTNPNDMETLVDWTRELGNHYKVSGLHNNTIYYWQVCQRNDGCPEGIDGTIWSFTTHLNVPSYLWANSDQIFEGDWNALYWDAPAERGLLSYNVYQDGLLIGNTTDTYYEISNLPYNMNGYRFNVTAVYDEGESGYSNDYWVYVSGYGTVEGYVYEQDGTTPIEGAAVNFTGYNEFWWYSNFQFITDAHGHYRGTLCAGNYNVQASGNGYQTKDYNENVYIGYNVNTSGINFILDEQFKPVGNVVAEYYPDANDPNSPYVKVYWSDAANLVEDFETGDFSKFDWQMGAYPWQITTDYPYEGNFCMKSGNQGYHNTTSWIQVTVYVPYDSYITFNGRMSSEDGCDYGEFYIDGNWYDGWSGYIDWFEASYPVSAGTHDFTWNYSKDGSVDSNDDSFYVDNICFASQERGERSFQHYRVYRTDEYNYGPFNEDNTVVLAEATNDTLLIDISWSSLEMGSYKYGVSCVYEGNRESEIRWGGLQQIQPKLTCSSRQQHVRHQGNNRDEVIFRDGFENGMDNWTTIDADGDGYCWEMGSNLAHNGSGYVTSSSWMSNIGMLYPDNYLVTPQVSLGGIFSFWACAEDASYAADHFGVAVSTGSNNNPNDFTLVQEWTMTAKGNRYDGPRGSRSQGNWYYYEVDLSEYSGQTGYIALRHFNCSDWYYLNVDDVELWMNSLPVQGPRESQIVWSNPMAKDLLLTDGAVNVTVSLNSGDSPEGTVVNFYNLDYNEQMYHPVADVVLDGSGYYAWDLFRKGEYYVTISKEGYGTVSEYVSIYEPTALQYQLEEIMTGISDLYVSRTGWATWSGPYVNGFAVPTTNSTFEFNFESNLEGWTNIDADGDGHVWYHCSEAGNHGTQAITSHNGTGHLMGESYCNSNGVLYPDNYLVSPQQYRITNGSTLNFWACTQDVNYPAEHFGVAISTASNTNPYDFTTIAEWTITAKSGQSTKGGTGRDGAEGMRAGEWYQFTCDLSAYAGQQAWIALRHFNCSDMFIVCVDELTLSTNAKDGDRHLQNVQVMLSDLSGNILYTGETENDYMQLPVESLVEGQTYHLVVGSVYSSGLSNWDEVDWVYEPCDNYEGATNLLGQTVDEGVMLSWTYPEIDSSSTQTRGSMVYACKDESTWINYDLSNPYNTTALNYFTVRGGDYCSRDGYVYATNSYNWYKIEPQTGIIAEQGNFDLYCFYDCAWDRTTNTMYGNYDSDLYTWNLETKELQYIGNLGNSFAVLACDRNGQLYGIAFEFPANLYKINKYNASTEWVGSIGYDCDYYYQSGAIDPSSGKFYWACYPRNNGSLIEVNLQTGAGTELYTGIGEQNSFCFSSSFDTDFDIAAMIFRDGEYLGITTDSTFLDEGGSREHEYTMRVVYGGEAICPDENFYFSMSCPQTFEVYGPIVTQTTQFAEGWTWWSTYVNQDHIDGLNLLEEGLGDNGMQIKSQTQFVQNYGEIWMGTLSDIDNESSYMVQVSAPCTVSMTTEQVVPYDHPITLNEGWNWVGYPSASAASVSNALSGHMPAEGDFLKSQTSCAIYYSALGWIGSLKTLTPGIGLMYKSNSNETISFTYTVDRMDNLEDNITAAGNRWEPNVQAYPNNMSVLAVVELDDNELRNENYELAAFVNGECRGSAKLMFVESLNRYMAFLTVYGEEASELNFGLYDVETGMTTFESNEHLNFVTNAITGDLMEPYVVSFRSTTAIDELDGNLQIYPNPVGKGNIFSITMPIGGSKVQVEIVNALGVVEMQYITSTQTPMTFKAPNVAGVYTLRIIVEGQRPYIRKLIVR